MADTPTAIRIYVAPVPTGGNGVYVIVEPQGVGPEIDSPLITWSGAAFDYTILLPQVN